MNPSNPSTLVPAQDKPAASSDGQSASATVIDFYVTLTTLKQHELVHLLDTFQLTSTSSKMTDMRDALTHYFRSHPAPRQLYDHLSLRHLVRIGSRGKWQQLPYGQAVRWHPYEFKARSSQSALDTLPAAKSQNESELSKAEIERIERVVRQGQPPVTVESVVRGLFDLDFDDSDMVLSDESLLRAIEKDVEATWKQTSQGDPYKSTVELTKVKMRTKQTEQNIKLLHEDLRHVEKKASLSTLIAAGVYQKTNAVNARVTDLQGTVDTYANRAQRQYENLSSKMDTCQLMALAAKEAVQNCNEQQDRALRSRRIVIFGLSIPEEGMLFPFHPDAEVGDLFSSLGVPAHIHFAAQRIVMRNVQDPARCAMLRVEFVFTTHRDEVLRLWNQYVRDYDRRFPGHRPEPRIRKDLTKMQLAEDLDTQAKVNYLRSLHPNINYLKRDNGRVVIPTARGVVDVSPETMALCTAAAIQREKEKILQGRATANAATDPPPSEQGMPSEPEIPDPDPPAPPLDPPAVGSDTNMADPDDPDRTASESDEPPPASGTPGPTQFSNTELRADPIKIRSTQSQWVVDLEKAGATQFLDYTPTPEPDAQDPNNIPPSEPSETPGSPARLTRAVALEALKTMEEEGLGTPSHTGLEESTEKRGRKSESEEEEPGRRRQANVVTESEEGRDIRQDKGKGRAESTNSVRRYIEQGSKKRRVGSPEEII